MTKITFLFTDPKHFLHGFWMGQGFKFTSPDSSNKYLKNESWFLSFSLESVYNDRFLSSIGILSQKEKNLYEQSYFVPIGIERSQKVGLWFCMMQKHRNRPGFLEVLATFYFHLGISESLERFVYIWYLDRLF